MKCSVRGGSLTGRRRDRGILMSKSARVKFLLNNIIDHLSFSDSIHFDSFFGWRLLLLGEGQLSAAV